MRTLPSLVWVLAASVASPVLASDVLYEALLGAPESVDAALLLDTPGRFAGRAVVTRGRLERRDAKPPVFELQAGPGRVLLRLEPEAASLATSRAASWVGHTVEVEGLFYRDAGATSVGSHALRAWRVEAVGDAARSPARSARDETALSLEALVYGAGRYDGRLVRVRGAYRGSNLHDDLPEATRRSRKDWILKDGYFAAWITGREARGEDWDLTQRSRADTVAALEVVGIPTTSNGIVRIAARTVETSLAPAPAIVSRALPTGDAGWAAVPPHLTFAFPVPGEALARRGLMLTQFSKPMDAGRFESGVHVRFERDGVAAGTPHLKFEYDDRYRALVITPEPAPPPGVDVVVELLDILVDVDGRALTAREARATPMLPVVESIRFHSAP